MILTAFQPNAFQTFYPGVPLAFQIGENSDGADHQIYRKKKQKPRDFDQELDDKRKRREAIVEAVYGPVDLSGPVLPPVQKFLPAIERQVELGGLPDLLMAMMHVDPEEEAEVEAMLEAMALKGLL